MKIVYIFGAGASASIDERVPVMANFFEKAVDMLDEDNKVFWITFAFAEEARAFPSNPEIENLGVQMGALGRLYLEKIEKSKISIDIVQSVKNTDDIIRGKLADAIIDYKKAFLKDNKRKSANLEDVFSKMEAFKERSSVADQTYDRLQYVINRLFYQLNEDLQDKFSVAAHHELSQFVANTKDVEHIFISFNYDLWLEKALFKKGLWNPRDGHGSYVFQYYLPPLNDVTPENETTIIGNLNEPKEFSYNSQDSKVKVLKPHGSLAWRCGTNNPDNLVVILENGENSCVTYNNAWSLPSSIFQENAELFIIPLIVPPIPNKIRSHPLFWATDKNVYNALLHADIVVIVGWSMPLSDRYLQDIIFKALNNREEQIRKLIICDKQAADEHLLSKFEGIFRPLEIKSWLYGFSREFIDFLKKEL
ncbi:MAG: hypothetical protein AB1480_15610 [Nitrospirota bacterium]